jgi:hypothetical protein
MKVTKISNNKELIEYASLNEFYNYITTTPVNKAFTGKECSSHSTKYTEFYGTKDFQEAVELLKNGWTEMSEKLTKELKSNIKVADDVKRYINELSVCGYQAIVPLYLQGVPNNMVNKKVVAVKQKVITINKNICYWANINQETIINESVKALQIIRKIEAQGMRCNLNIIWGAYSNNKEFYVKVRIKNANEKLNISKLSFPLVHPSMLRRLMFRFEEVYPNITSSFAIGYGHVISTWKWNELLKNTNEINLPSVFKQDVNKIHSLEDLQNMIAI